MAKTKSAPSTTVTAVEILKSAGIARRTFNRWMDAGLVPRPQMVQPPSGRGQVGMWPWWVSERAHRIRELQAKGVPLSQVLVTLDREAAIGHLDRVVGAEREADRWLEPGSAKRLFTAKAVKWKAKSRTRGGKEEIADLVVVDRHRKLKVPLRTASMAQVFGIHVEKAAKDAGLSKPHAGKLCALAAERPVLQTALELFLLGYNPVLLWDGNNAKVIPDVMVPMVFSFTWMRLTANTRSALKMPGHPLKKEVWPFAYCVINLWPLLRTLIPFGADSDTPAAYTTPLYLPSFAVTSMDRDDSAPMEYPFKVIPVGPHPADLQMQVLLGQGRPLPPLTPGDSQKLMAMVELPTAGGSVVGLTDVGLTEQEATQRTISPVVPIEKKYSGRRRTGKDRAKRKRDAEPSGKSHRKTKTRGADK